MKIYPTRIWLSIVAVVWLCPCPLQSEEVQPGSPAASEASAPEGASSVPRKITYNRPDTVRKLEYRPPFRGAPTVRVTGASRGGLGGGPSLSVLAPAHLGLTTKAQPSLFWHQSKPAAANFELTLVEGNKIKPVLQVKIESANQAGIQRLRLADHKVSLAANVEYQWIVALVTDPDNRSRDILASGYIKRIIPPEELAKKLGQTAPSELPFVYAEEGIWYDALEALSDQIDASPNNQALHDLRADLLHQVDLDEAAKFDSKLMAEDASRTRVVNHTEARPQ